MSTTQEDVRTGLTGSTRLKIEHRSVDSLKPYQRNARTHSDKQVAQIAGSIRKFGFVNPVLIGDGGEVIAGHGRVLAAKQLGIVEVPTLLLAHLTEAERRAYRIADNKLAELAGWDESILRIEFASLAELDLDFDLELTGFDTAEIDLILDGGETEPDEDDQSPAPQPGPAVTRPGDVWILGEHRLVCGDATDTGALDQLMQGNKADCVFTDPPYNVKIDGNVCGSGTIKHREFAMASGEMDVATFTKFLRDALSVMASHSRDGSIHFVCIDWRHMGELREAGDAVYSELKNLVVWAKTNGGMGTFYRSQHELIFVFKVGTVAHTNTFGLGGSGRYRTNVWSYPGVNSFGKGQGDLNLHPTVKPVAMVADAIKDVTKRRQVVLDAFGGSGTTLIAAERTGRVARLVELDPLYCDVIYRRFEKLTGTAAVLETTGEAYADVALSESSVSEMTGGEHEQT